MYIHVPFCERKCVYCDFYSTVSTEFRAVYVDALIREIELRAPCARDTEFHTVFLGGGTPSLLSPGELARLTDALKREFTIAGGAEFTMECNPGTVDRPALAAFRDAGVNRLSIGVQSFHDDELRFLTRIHDAEDGVAAVHAARQAGFENVGIDLMFALPAQTPEKWRFSIEQTLKLDVEHISCYSLTVEDGTPLAAVVRDGMIRRPDEESEAALFELAMDALEERGYRHYEVSNYALPGRECRHNTAYWRQEDYIGLGPSAHSTWSGARSWNHADIGAYIERLKAGETPAAGGERLTPEILRAERIFLSLRCGGLDLNSFDDDFASANADALRRLRSHGLLEVSQGLLRLTRRGMLLCDEICAILE